MGMRIQDLKSATGDYARAYLFQIYFTSAPVPITGGETLASYLVRTSSLPESTIEAIEVPYQGQVQKIASTHTFAEWSVTFNLDIAAELRRNFERWQRFIHDPVTNAHNIPRAYYGTVKAELLGNQGQVAMSYTLNDVWPSAIGALELGQDSKDVAQFDVTFTYNWHESDIY